jgi:hypothetical protein
VLPRDKCLVSSFWSAPGSQDSQSAPIV